MCFGEQSTEEDSFSEAIDTEEQAGHNNFGLRRRNHNANTYSAKQHHQNEPLVMNEVSKVEQRTYSCPMNLLNRCCQLFNGFCGMISCCTHIECSESDHLKSDNYFYEIVVQNEVFKERDKREQVENGFNMVCKIQPESHLLETEVKLMPEVEEVNLPTIESVDLNKVDTTISAQASIDSQQSSPVLVLRPIITEVDKCTCNVASEDSSETNEYFQKADKLKESIDNTFQFDISSISNCESPHVACTDFTQDVKSTDATKITLTKNTVSKIAVLAAMGLMVPSPITTYSGVNKTDVRFDLPLINPQAINNSVRNPNVCGIDEKQNGTTSNNPKVKRQKDDQKSEKSIAERTTVSASTKSSTGESTGEPGKVLPGQNPHGVTITQEDTNDQNNLNVKLLAENKDKYTSEERDDVYNITRNASALLGRSSSFQGKPGVSNFLPSNVSNLNHQSSFMKSKMNKHLSSWRRNDTRRMLIAHPESANTGGHALENPSGDKKIDLLPTSLFHGIDDMYFSMSAEKIKEVLDEIATHRENNDYGHIFGVYLNKDLDLNKSRCVQFLGSGSFGRVWKFEIDQPNRETFVFACKQISLKKFRWQEPFTLFENCGGCFPKLYGVIQIQDMMFLMMEFMPITLALLDRQNIRDKAYIEELFYKLLMAVHTVNEGGYIHKDIKPSNVGFDHNGVVKLLDLGTVWRLDDDSKRAKEGGTTPAFMSPLQHKGEDDRNCDVYAVACTLLCWITNRTQCDFMGKKMDKEEISRMIASGENHSAVYHIIGLTNGMVSAQLAGLLSDMLKFDTDERKTTRDVLKNKIFKDYACSGDISSITAEDEYWKRPSNIEGIMGYIDRLEKEKIDIDKRLQSLHKVRSDHMLASKSMGTLDSGYMSTLANAGRRQSLLTTGDSNVKFDDVYSISDEIHQGTPKNNDIAPERRDSNILIGLEGNPCETKL